MSQILTLTARLGLKMPNDFSARLAISHKLIRHWPVTGSIMEEQRRRL